MGASRGARDYGDRHQSALRAAAVPDVLFIERHSSMVRSRFAQILSGGGGLYDSDTLRCGALRSAAIVVPRLVSSSAPAVRARNDTILGAVGTDRATAIVVTGARGACDLMPPCASKLLQLASIKATELAKATSGAICSRAVSTRAEPRLGANLLERRAEGH
jgi:hypothetical protein